MATSDNSNLQGGSEFDHLLCGLIEKKQRLTISRLLLLLILFVRSPKNVIFLMILLAGLVGLVPLLLFATGLRAAEITLNLGGNTVVLKGQSLFGTTQYIAVVHPQGWQDTGIKVRQGNHLGFRAGGMINIDVEGLVENSKGRDELEARKEKKLHLRRDNTKDAPEDYYDTEERKMLVLPRPWVDPDGFPNSSAVDLSWAVREKRRMKPNTPVGALLAFIQRDGARAPSAESPDPSDVLFIGRRQSITADRDGILWFIVNDIRYSHEKDDPDNADLFYRDNVGGFWVQIDVGRFALREFLHS